MSMSLAIQILTTIGDVLNVYIIACWHQNIHNGKYKISFQKNI